MLGNLPGLRVLDAGCGNGYLSRMLAGRGAQVTSVEPGQALFGFATEQEAAAPLGIRYVQADLCGLPGLGAPFDTDFHRTLSAYLNKLIALGCQVTELAEPGLDPEAAAGGPGGIGAYVHLPNFLIVAARRAS